MRDSRIVTFIAHVAQNITVVTVNYRLGIFGFFTHPELTTESVDHAGANHTFASISANPSAPDVQAAIHTLSQDADVAKASYEVSLLQVPALGVRAVWLHDASGKAPDLLVPVAPVRSELIAGRKYTVAEFAAALKDAAAKILANDDPRKGS